MNSFRALLKDEGGATAIEYGLIAALIGVVLITALANLEDDLTATFDKVGSELEAARTE